MKTIFSLLGGAVTLTEQGGSLTLSWDESLGGGEAAGILQGKGSLVLNGSQGIKLAEAMLNSLLPASVQPLATVVEGIANQAIASIE